MNQRDLKMSQSDFRTLVFRSLPSALAPAASSMAHKGDFGHVLTLVGGDYGMGGASVVWQEKQLDRVRVSVQSQHAKNTLLQ